MRGAGLLCVKTIRERWRCDIREIFGKAEPQPLGRYVIDTLETCLQYSLDDQFTFRDNPDVADRRRRRCLW